MPYSYLTVSAPEHGSHCNLEGYDITKSHHHPSCVLQFTYFPSMPTLHHANNSSACLETFRQKSETVLPARHFKCLQRLKCTSVIAMQLPGTRSNNCVQRGILGHHLQTSTIQALHYLEPQTLHRQCHHPPLLEMMSRQTTICIQLVCGRWSKISTQLQLMTQTLTVIMNMHRLMFGMQGRFVIYLILAPSIG